MSHDAYMYNDASTLKTHTQVDMSPPPHTHCRSYGHYYLLLFIMKIMQRTAQTHSLTHTHGRKKN